MISALLLNEWAALLRDGRGRLLLALAASMAVVSTWTAASTDERERSGQAIATESARHAWLEKEADNPHSRAHYGDYVFRPSGPLAGLDSGLQVVTGRSIRLEAHGRNAAVHVPQRAASTLLRFDRLEPSTVLNLLVPLILILVGFGSVASERESGRLQLLSIQGARPADLLIAKSLALWSVGAALAALVVGAHLLFTNESLALAHTIVYLLLYLVSLWIVAVLVVCVSSWTRRSGTAASLLLGAWVVSAIVLPRLGAAMASAAVPLPSRDAFEAAMREDREKGLNGHNPSDERNRAVEQKVLETYGVTTKEELPVNLDGFLMQADEEYGNRVWDKHFNELEERQRRQSAIVGPSSFANPLQATDRLSMAIAGTDLLSHFALLQQAEVHRRALVESLNHEHAHGGSKTGDWSWKADPEFYASFDAFRFEPLPLRNVVARRAVEWSALATWMLGASVMLLWSARRLKRGAIL